jgi:hypothetical protein
MQSEVEKAIKEMRDKKATGHDDMPGDILRLFGEDGLRIMAQLISSIFETGERPKNFTEVTMTALQKSEATQCSDDSTIGLIAHRAKTVARILRRRTERKIEDIIAEDQFGFRRRKEPRDAIGMLRIISK